MKLNITKEVAALEQMTVGQLQQRYVEVLGEPRPQPPQAVPHPPNRLAAPGKRRGWVD